MHKRKLLIILIAMIGLVTLTCNRPDISGNKQDEVEQVLTSSAQTVEALQTGIALFTPSTTASTAVPTITLQATQVMAATNTYPPIPTQLPTRLPVPCNLAGFVDDITIQDGTKFSPGESFVKTWRLKNIGTCTWTTAYSAYLDAGTAMDAPASVPLPSSVAPGQSVDISIQMRAPNEARTYRGNWKLKDQNGTAFGLAGGNPFYVDIEVVAPQSLVYDFAANYCQADWTSNTGILPCPGSTTGSTGYVQKMDNPTLENNIKITGSALETHPRRPADTGYDPGQKSGWIQGVYPAISIQSGYRFRAQIGCLQGATQCNVNFHLQYNTGSAWQSLSPTAGWNELYDSSTRSLDIDLSALAGKNVEFMLQIESDSDAGEDWPVWVQPRIEKP